MKRFICFSLCLLMLLPMFSSCGAPEYSEIDARFRELVEASAEINTIFFGEGLPTYERVTDPRDTTDTYKDEVTGVEYYYYTYEDEEVGSVLAYRLNLNSKVYQDPDTGKKYFYYNIYDDTYGSVVVIMTVDGDGDRYLQLLSAPKDGVEPDYVDGTNGKYGYFLTGFSYEKDMKQENTYLRVSDKEDETGTLVYFDEGEGLWYYALGKDYKEPEFQSYYDANDPTTYDYVTFDCEYRTVDDIKAAAEQVYSEDYLKSIYTTMFDGSLGAASGLEGVTARYIQYATADGNSLLMQSNVYRSFIFETRQYDFSTAKIGRGSNSRYVNVEVDTYLPSAPDDRLNVRISMVYEKGKWMLDSPTY